MAQLLRQRARPRVRNGSMQVILLVAASLCGFEVGAEGHVKRPNIRDVTPPGIMRVYGASSEAASSRVETRQFNNVRVLADGMIRAGAVTISLYGVVLPARDKLCVSQTGAQWACGLSAIGFLRNMIHGRTIDCTVQGDYIKKKDRFVGSCRIGKTDIGLRLLEQGWATLAPNIRERHYLEASEAGEQNGLGIRTGALGIR